jgi:hypothetical protein
MQYTFPITSIHIWLKNVSRHVVSTQSVFTVFRLCFTCTQPIHAFYQILFVYTPVIQVPTVTLFIRSSFRFTSSLSIRTWCTLHFTCCVYKPDTHVLSTFTVSIDSWYTRLILLAVSRHSWYTSFFFTFLSVRGYSNILFCSGVSILRW